MIDWGAFLLVAGVSLLSTVVVVVATGWVPLSTCRSAVMVVPGGLGRDTPEGTKPTVINWRLANLRSAACEVVRPPTCTSWFPEDFVVTTHERACTSPTLPASGVPLGHRWPFLYRTPWGYWMVVLVRVSPV